MLIIIASLQSAYCHIVMWSHELQYIFFPLVYPIPLPLPLIAASSLFISLHYITVY